MSNLGNIRNYLSGIVEDYYSDKESRDKALEAYGSILSSIKHIHPEENGWSLARIGNKRGIGGVFNFKPEGIRVVVIAYYGGKSSSANGSWNLENKSINLYSSINLSDDKYWDSYGDFDDFKFFEDVRWYLENSDTRETFVHEYTHYLDSLRYDNPDYLTRNNNSGKIKGYTGFKDREGRTEDERDVEYKAYLSQPSEFNAFYQTFISRLEDSLNGYNLQYLRSIFNSYEYFTVWMEERYFSEDILTHIYKDTSFSKRLSKRLYSFYKGYSEYIDKLEDNILSNLVGEVRSLIEKTRPERLKRVMSSYTVSPSFYEVISIICDKLPLFENYLTERKGYEEYYNFKNVELVAKIIVQKYPELKELVEEGLSNWSEETGW